jgi:hypothetical protein
MLLLFDKCLIFQASIAETFLYHFNQQVGSLEQHYHPLLLVRWVHLLVYLELLEVFTFISIPAILELSLILPLPPSLLPKDLSHLKKLFAIQLVLRALCGSF